MQELVTWAGHRRKRQNASATTVLHARPPTAPSTVFLGLMLISWVRPRVLPKAYAPVSAAMVQATVMNVAMRPTVQCVSPPKSTCSSCRCLSHRLLHRAVGCTASELAHMRAQPAMLSPSLLPCSIHCQQGMSSHRAPASREPQSC